MDVIMNEILYTIDKNRFLTIGHQIVTFNMYSHTFSNNLRY